MSAPAAASSSSTAPKDAKDSKKRKELSPAEQEQKELLDSLFRSNHSSVLAKAVEALGPAPKKAKLDPAVIGNSNEAEQKAAAPAFNPFVAAMDAGAGKAAPSAVARTQNGAASLSTTKAPCLDLFYHMARGYSQADINAALPPAWKENPETLLKVLCHARDCHTNGKGEKLITYYALLWLRMNKPRTYLANLTNFLSHGYFKDLVNMVHMIDGNVVVQSAPAPKTKVRKGRSGNSNKKAGPKSQTIGNAYSSGSSSSSSNNKLKPVGGPLGSSGLELQLLAEYLKADWIKLKAWRNAKKAWKAKEAAATAEKNAAAAAEAQTAQAKLNAGVSASSLTAEKASTAWFDCEDDVLEDGELGDDEDWEDVRETTAKVGKLEIKEEYMSDVAAPASATVASSSSTSAPVSISVSVTKSDVSKPADHCFISLAAKWAPSEGHKYDYQAKRLAKILFSASGPTAKFANVKHMQACLRKYRAMLSTLRSHLCITEKLACEKRWSVINFNAVPSKAHQILKKAFMKHCGQRYQTYLAGLKKGVGKIQTTGLAPHELVDYYLRGGDLNDTVEEAWKALVLKTKEAGTFQGAVSVVDVSGSMSGLPMRVAIAMGLLVAELCDGVYHNRVLTFHESPSWWEIKGVTLKDRVSCLQHAPWGGNTNLIKTFDLILDVAVQHKIAQEFLPSTLFIFSDMQFDVAVGGGVEGGWMKTNYQYLKQKWAGVKYKLPNIVFWNLNGAINKDCPVNCDTEGCALMSGFSAQLLNVFLKTPMAEVEVEADVPMTAEEKAQANPLHPLRIMMKSIEEYTVVVDESER